jgi:hypothetical protein
MKSQRLEFAILRAASLLAPAEQRAEWLAEWRSEVWYVPPSGAARFCLGAFRDALWLRRNNPGPMSVLTRLDSPIECLAFLATLAAAGMFLARLPMSRDPMLPSALSDGMALGSMAIALLLHLLAPAATIRAMADYHPLPWACRLRRWIFVVLKTAFALLIVSCGLFILSFAVGPVACQGFVPASIVALRWVVIDQRQRCPVCLCLLTNPVRIGRASEMFLDWYGTESMCSRGHGLLHAPEIPTSCYDRQEWLHLDGSWSSLFSGAAGMRR